jgi:hypothetical protein
VLDQQLTSELSVRTLGVLGAGQMGLGIAYVAALRAQVPRVLLCDRSEPQITRSLALMDRLLAKDVQKGRLSDADARAARERVVVVKEGISGLGECDMVVEVRSCAFAVVVCTEYLSVRRLPKIWRSSRACSSSWPRRAGKTPSSPPTHPALGE